MMRDFEQLSRAADEAGFRLSVVRGLAVVEASPFLRHQSAVDRIRTSIPTIQASHGRAGCFPITDVQIRFPDGSRLRPDISIFRRIPDELDSDVTLIPEAVIEILNPGFEAKDLIVTVPFYQQLGIPDIIVFDPATDIVHHWQNGGSEQIYTSPKTLSLLCGCTCTV